MYAWKVFGTASVGIALGVASKLVPWPSLAVWKAQDRIDDQNDADAKLARLASDAVGFGATRTQQLEAVATGRRLLKTRADDSAVPYCTPAAVELALVGRSAKSLRARVGHLGGHPFQLRRPALRGARGLRGLPRGALEKPGRRVGRLLRRGRAEEL